MLEDFDGDEKQQDENNLRKKLFFSEAVPKQFVGSDPTDVGSDWEKKSAPNFFFGVRPLSWFRKCHVTWNDVDVDKSRIGSERERKNSHSGPTNCQNAKRVCARERKREKESVSVRACVREKSDSRKSGHLRQSDLYRWNFEASIDGAAERTDRTWTPQTAAAAARIGPVAPPIVKVERDFVSFFRR